MLLSTITELKTFFPTHAMDNIEIMQGAIDNSEHDFLLEKIGKPLYTELQSFYNKVIEDDDILSVIPPYESEPSAWVQLLNLCQRVVAYNAFYRSADVQAVSVNNSGFNRISAEGYDSSDEKSMERFKAACNKEAHAAINRLLVTLEQWAQETTNDEEIQKIVSLWQQSKFFYLVEGLLINTASCLNEFVDIYDSREKFINMIPDLRYIQELFLIPEFGDKLITLFVSMNNKGTSDSVSSHTLKMLQRVMSIHLEARNKLLLRKGAHDEAVMMTKQTVNFIEENYDHFVELYGEDIFSDSPIKKKSLPPTPVPTDKGPQGKPSANVKRKVFFMPGLN